MTAIISILFSLNAIADISDAPAQKDFESSTPEAASTVSFNIHADRTGAYHLYLWLLPVKLSNGSFAVYDVKVNDVNAGSISPTRGNWQAIGLDGDKKVNLRKGTNNIKICSRKHILPQVQNIDISLLPQNLINVETEYNNFLEKAKEKRLKNEDAEFMRSLNSNSEGRANRIVNFYEPTEMDLIYTFNSIQYFERGKDITIYTTSTVKHVLDVMIYIIPYPIAHNVHGNVNKYEDAKTGIVIPPPVNIGDDYAKMNVLGQLPTIEQSQGLGWFFVSDFSKKSNLYTTKARLKIPLTGYYLIHMRRDYEGDTTTADLNINNEYFYEDVPISLSMCECNIPADNKDYTAIAKATNYKADPMIFIHGADAYRLVGFNDDRNEDEGNKWGLWRRESCISQKYLIPATAISVSNYSSLTPVFTCTIKGFETESGENAPMKGEKADGHSTLNIELASLDNSPQVTIYCEYIRIESEGIIKSVSLTSIDGLKLFETQNDCKDVSIRTDGLSPKSMCILSISMKDGNIYSRKILLK